MTRRTGFRWLKGLLLATMAVIGFLGASRVSPDRLLAKSYGPILGDFDTSWASRPANLWFSASVDAPAPLGRPLAIGDRITITSRASSPEMVEVVAIEDFHGEAFGPATLRAQLVTGRSESNHSGGVVRFLFALEVDGSTLAPAGRDKAL